MARAVANKLYRTFVAGLRTESNELTYPENATTAEDNCIIYRKGNRTRRLGFNIEAGGTTLPFTQDPNAVTQEFTWRSVANRSSLNFLVQQLGNLLYFYDLGVDVTSTGRKNFIINLDARLAPNKVTAANLPVQMASGKGFLFVVGQNIEPFLVDFNPDTDEFDVSQVYIQIRDFKGLDDGLANDEEPESLSAEHHYNLRNQGWVNAANDGSSGNVVQYFDNFGNSASYTAPDSTPITAYYTAISRYPANNKQWWAARDATTNDFDPELLAKFYSGNNRAPRGHYVVNAFYIDRTAISGISGLSPETAPDRPVSVAFFGGRAFYLAGSTLYFSQVLEDKRKAGFCYQEADPTAEDFNELLPTDGGVVPIPEMSKGVKLVPLGNSLVVFASNGIWSITGTSAGFTATDYSVSKVNPIGTDYPNTIVETEEQIYWWSAIGIMAMAVRMGQFGVVDGVFEKTNITEQTIQSFYNNDIPDDRKQFAKGRYDPATNTIQWLYADNALIPSYSYNRILNLDLTLQAFYPWSIDTGLGPRITGIFNTPFSIPLDHLQVRDTTFKFTFISPVEGFWYGGFGLFNDETFADWRYFDNVGVGYMSFCETGYELLEDAMRQKQTPWVFTYFRRTEENYVPDESGDYTSDKPSSCYFQTKWDWSNSSISGKWSTKVQAYRHRRLPMFDESDLSFETGYSIVVSRHKVRGVGKAIQFRFECDEIGKDFDILGWSGNFTGETNV